MSPTALRLSPEVPVTDDTPSAIDVAQADHIAASPLPTPRTLRRRQNLLFQAVQFVHINLRMMRVIAAKHS